jgi:hypothetical protein
MKFLNFSKGLFLTFLGLFPLASHAIVSTEPVIRQMLSVIGILEESGHQVLFAQIDNISKKQVSTQTYPLKPGRYKITVIGDDTRVLDMDLAVFNEVDSLISQDNDSMNVAIVTIVLDWSQTVKIKMSAHQMQASDAFFALVIARED